MELWIRSQDRMALAKFDLCVLEQYEGKYMFIADHYKNMGTYKSKERVLEVLDEIQKKINLINLGHDFGSPMIDLENPTYIYEMPKEITIKADLVEKVGE